MFLPWGGIAVMLFPIKIVLDGNRDGTIVPMETE